MKLSKKLIAAIGMLTLSAVMLVTSSFAWFSMNENVSATGMNVTAKGEQIYLQIVNANGESNETKTSAASTVTAPVDGLLPTAPKTADGENIKDTYDGGAPIWVNAVGTSISNGDKNGNYAKVDDSVIANYVLKNTFTISLDANAGITSVNKPLKVSSVLVNNGSAAQEFTNSLSVLVVSTIGEEVKGSLWGYTDGTWGCKNGEGVLSANTFAGPATIDVYVFFDGDHDACTLQNLVLAKEVSYSVDVNFTVA